MLNEDLLIYGKSINSPIKVVYDGVAGSIKGFQVKLAIYAIYSTLSLAFPLRLRPRFLRLTARPPPQLSRAASAGAGAWPRATQASPSSQSTSKVSEVQPRPNPNRPWRRTC